MSRSFVKISSPDLQKMLMAHLKKEDKMAAIVDCSKTYNIAAGFIRFAPNVFV